MTLDQFLDEWLVTCVRSNVRPRTYQSYEEIVRLHISPGLGRQRLARLSPTDVHGFLNDKVAAGYSRRSAQYYHAVLRRALGQAVKWGLVQRNVAKLVDPPKVRRPEVLPLSPENARAFLLAVHGDRLEALYSVALAVGLRRGEALGLRWRDIDLEKGELMVRNSLQRVGGRLELTELKTERSRRTISLPQTAVNSLRLHRARQLQDRLLAGSRWRDAGLVFATTVGTPLEPRNVLRHFHRALEEAGLPRKRFHDLRHTCASLLLAQGVAARVVMEILGHSQIGLTMNTYSHVMPTLQKDAARRMDAILNGE